MVFLLFVAALLFVCLSLVSERTILFVPTALVTFWLTLGGLGGLVALPYAEIVGWFRRRRLERQADKGTLRRATTFPLVVAGPLEAVQWFVHRFGHRVRGRRPVVLGVALFVLLVLMLWESADITASHVVNQGGSTGLLDTSIFQLLGVHPMPVSPCLINLGGEQTPAHLRAAVIVGESDGQTYLVGVAGSAGFRGIPVGHVVTFHTDDASLSTMDLDGEKSSWTLAPHPIPADTKKCPPGSPGTG